MTQPAPKYRELLDTLRPFLPDYLRSHGREPDRTGKFTCPNPAHQDTHPSGHFVPDSGNEYFKCFACLPASERVWTARGFSRIDEVKAGDVVLAADGKPNNVLNVVKHPQEVPVLRIRTTTDHEGLLATSNHDMLWLPEPVSERGDLRSDYRRTDRLYQAELRHLRPGDWVPTACVVQSYDQAVLKVPTGVSSPKDRRGKKIDLHDPETCWVLGLYAAEGSISGGRAIHFAIHQDEILQFHPRLDRWAQQFGCKATIFRKTDSRGADLIVCHVGLAKLFESLVGAGCAKKRCPDPILRGPIRSVASWLAGLLDGDGNKSTDALGVTSQDLADATFLIAIRCGALPSRRKTQKPAGKKPVFSVGFLHGSSKIIREWASGIRTSLESQVHKDVCFLQLQDGSWCLASRIESITSDKAVGFYQNVWDIQTDQGTFTTGTLSVHNCGAKGDIFQAAHFLEGRPLTGGEFLRDNVLYLAQRFSVKVEEIEPSEQELQRGDILRTYQLAGTVLETSMVGEPLQKQYGWTLEQVRSVEPHVGSIAWDDFMKRMREMGDYSATYLESIGISNRLFDNFRITFALKNGAGLIIGFAARDTRDVRPKGVPKWCNTPGTVPIFQKSDLLYGMHLAKVERGPIYLVEGYADALALWLSGCKKAVAVMSSALTVPQMRRLQQAGCTEVIIVPDWDKNGAGELATEAVIQNVFRGQEDFVVSVKPMPASETQESYDPQDFIRDHGLEAFRKLSETPAFDWMLNRLDSTLTAEQKMTRVFNLIVDEPRAVRQESMLTRLAIKIDMRIVALRRELDHALESRKQDVRRKLQHQVDVVRSKLDGIEPEKVPEMLRTQALQMEDIQGVKYSSKLHGPEDTVVFSEVLRKSFWEAGKTLSGWRTGLTKIDNALGGIPRRECWIGIAGDGNVGKSAIVQNIGLRVALHNENVAVLHFTIDDTRSQTIPRLISQMSEVKIAWVRQPQRYQFTAKMNADLQKAWATWELLLKDGKYDIKDASQGNTLAFAEEWIEAVHSDHPERGILFILDNFHLLSEAGQEERERVENASRNVSLLAKQKGIAIISTMELRKREDHTKRPRLEDLKGSKQLEYDLNVAILVHSEMHAKPDATDAQGWMDETDPDGVKKKPVLQLWMDKNKVTSDKGLMEYNFRSDTSQILEREAITAVGQKSGVVDD